MPFRHLHRRQNEALRPLPAIDVHAVGAMTGDNLIFGYVLAGGHSTRFGGDKARALYRGRPLLHHAVDSLRPVARRVSVIADTPDKYAGLLELAVGALTDRLTQRGPMGGLLAALDDLPEGSMAVLAAL
ncbi:MAG: hypothetical protein EXR77_19935 [Myxococcales bacterium]|nr:hypothetical protein [Myxococcales bacterium]